MTTPADVELANLAIRTGLVQKQQAIDCLRVVHTLAQQRTVKTVSEVFVEQGLITAEQATKLCSQASSERPAGQATAKPVPPAPQPVAAVAGKPSSSSAHVAQPAAAAPGTHVHTPLPQKPSQPAPAAAHQAPAAQRTPTPTAAAAGQPTQHQSSAAHGAPQHGTQSIQRPSQAGVPAAGHAAPSQARPAAAAPPGAVPPRRDSSRIVLTAAPGKPAHAAPPPPQAKPAQPPDPIPGYKITGKLGMGGMATVFLALDSKNKNRQVALKILFPHHAKNELFLQRFVRESELLVKFDHVNIVKGYDHGTANSLHFLAMEYIEGRSVQNMLDEAGSLSEETSLDIVLQMARALAYIQDNGIVHRDVKPDNVLVTPDGVVKLCDLGFAKPLGGPAAGAVVEEVTCGTPQYMSPEQAQGEAALDIRSDIYALGATLYHMAVGKLPFSGSDNQEIMAKQVLESLDSAEVKSRKISKHMHYFIERMMSKDKDFRYQSPHEMVEDIETQMEGWRTLQFNPEEAETDLGGFFKKARVDVESLLLVAGNAHAARVRRQDCVPFGVPHPP
ncbi:MAG: serine/threonine-protein kinase, partial [Planctomycetota bacterium]|nr:serine/threonine-protein kinase [Planctomycetota bacterium]